MAMLNKTENQSSGDECINNQAGRDINYNFYKGISSEECREICNNLFQENFIKLYQEAADIAFVRANNLIDLFLDKLSKMDLDIQKKIEAQLKKPAMQEAIFKAQKGYALTEEDNADIFIDLLISRGKAEYKSNTQLLTDEAIEILPKLNSTHLNILLFYLHLDSQLCVGTERNLKEYIDLLISIFNDVNKNIQYDLLYLEQLKCVEINSFIGKSIEQCILKQTQMFYDGFSKDEILSKFNENVLNNFFTKSLKNPENYVLIYNNLEYIKTQIYVRPVDRQKEIYDKIFSFYYPENTKVDDAIIRDIVLKYNPNLKIVFDSELDFRKYHFGLLGQWIAKKLYEIKTQKTVNFDFK